MFSESNLAGAIFFFEQRTDTLILPIYRDSQFNRMPQAVATAVLYAKLKIGKCV
jgi:hypothetical protein